MTISEKLSIFLVSAISYHFLSFHQEGSRKLLNFSLASVFLSWLALTKVFYGYVIFISIIIVILIILIFRIKLYHTFFILLTSLLLCIPYLYHNYNLTNKIFYWSTSGGLQLYWMSTPYSGETGTWFGKHDLEVLKIPVHNSHYIFYDKLSGLNPVERDDAYKNEAIKNILKHPFKYTFNVANNILRMVFDFPNDFQKQTWKTSWVVIPNMFLLSFFLASLYPTWYAFNKIPLEMWSILIFAIIAFLGSSLLSAYSRMFTVLVPIISIWTSYIWINLIEIKINRGSCIIHPDHFPLSAGDEGG